MRKMPAPTRTPRSRRSRRASRRGAGRRQRWWARTEWWKEERRGVFLDYNQNAKDRTVASVWSVRPTPDARVSMPLEAGKSANTSPLSRRARARARVEAGNQRPWPADKVERWAIERLIPYAKNARTHTDAQVAAIAASIREWGWTSPALVGEDGGLIAGHARILAARQLGIAEIPVMVAAGWSETQKRLGAIRPADRLMGRPSGLRPAN